jgi:hypothetical protein
LLRYRSLLMSNTRATSPLPTHTGSSWRNSTLPLQTATSGGVYCGCSCDVHLCSTTALVTFSCVLFCAASSGASALVTFICVLCTVRTRISRSLCNLTRYSEQIRRKQSALQLHVDTLERDVRAHLTVNMQLYTISITLQRANKNEAQRVTITRGNAGARRGRIGSEQSLARRHMRGREGTG